MLWFQGVFSIMKHGNNNYSTKEFQNGTIYLRMIDSSLKVIPASVLFIMSARVCVCVCVCLG